MSQGPSSAPSFNVETRSGLDYRYRDVFQTYVGQGEVVIEFGNVNRSDPNQIMIADRIVLSLPSAVRLTQHLGEQLKRAKDHIEAQRKAEPVTS
jgi:hypothetical protein